MRHNQAICLHALITPIQKYSKYKEIPSRLIAKYRFGVFLAQLQAQLYNIV